MRWTICLGLTLSLAACRQTVVLETWNSDAGGGVDSADSGAPACPGLPADFFIPSPEVFVALDRSSTMYAKFGESTPLAAARAALDMYAARFQNVVEFGYVEFPGTNSTTCTSNGQGACCARTPSAPSLNYAKFDIALHLCDQNLSSSCAPAGYERPTTAALGGIDLLFSQPDSASRYVLLITNGQPDCGGGQGKDCMDAQGIVNDLSRNFVTTFVLAPGQLDPMTNDCLTGIAINGARNPPYLRPASNPTELMNAISDLLHSIATDACVLEPTTTRITDPDRVSLFWGGMPIPRDRNNGWDLSGGGGFTTITLHGQACDQLIESGPAELRLFTNCTPPHH
jgi:hypothetical protein